MRETIKNRYWLVMKKNKKNFLKRQRISDSVACTLAPACGAVRLSVFALCGDIVFAYSVTLLYSFCLYCALTAKVA